MTHASASLPETPDLPLRIGEHLLAAHEIDSDQLRIALHEQKTSKLMLGGILVRLGFIDEETLTKTIAARAGMPFLDLAISPPDQELLSRFSRRTAQRCQAIPLRFQGSTLHIAMADPLDLVAQDIMRRTFPQASEILPVVASKAAIEDIIATLEEQAGTFEDLLKEIESGNPTATTESFDHPVVRLVSKLLTDASRQGASDIHLEPEGSLVRIRYRIDGSLRQVRMLHLTHWSALSHRIKIMSGMNIADTRSIQDGRFQMQIGGGDIDFRVAIMPSVWGETIVIRILDHRRSLLPLSDLGYSAHAQAQLHLIASKPQGLTLVTGPTGSGKTTTLYSLLQQLNAPDVHIATLEEPVEFQLDSIRQTAIQEQQGLDFASGVRGILRMDPDIIFIGEVRDGDTAQMALRAAMTGHQVYTTLHCNEALGALPRLIDLGLSPRILAGNLGGIIAQRLVRKLCPHCKLVRRATPDEMITLRCHGPDRPLIAEAKGCELCAFTGRKGRTVIAEVLPVTTALDDLIAKDAPRMHLWQAARNEGFVTLQEDGIARVLARDIALDDLRRAVDMSRTPAGEAA